MLSSVIIVLLFKSSLFPIDFPFSLSSLLSLFSDSSLTLLQIFSPILDHCRFFFLNFSLYSPSDSCSSISPSILSSPQFFLSHSCLFFSLCFRFCHSTFISSDSHSNSFLVPRLISHVVDAFFSQFLSLSHFFLFRSLSFDLPLSLVDFSLSHSSPLRV